MIIDLTFDRLPVRVNKIMNPVQACEYILLLLVFKWNLLDVAGGGHGKQKLSPHTSPQTTLWLPGPQEMSALAVGNGHEVNRLPRRCSQSNLSVGRFLAGFWDLNEKVGPCRGSMSKFLGQNVLSIVSIHT